MEKKKDKPEKKSKISKAFEFILKCIKQAGQGNLRR